MKGKYTKFFIALALIFSTLIFTVYKLQFHEVEDNAGEFIEDLGETEIPVSKEIFGIKLDSFTVSEHKVEEKENLSLILGRENIGSGTIYKIVQLSDTVFNVDKGVRTNNTYYLFHNQDSAKALHYFIYVKNYLEYVVFDLSDSLQVYNGKRKLTKTFQYAKGTIQSSLSQTLLDQHLSISLSHKMEDIYAWTINFFALQKGDSFEIVYEKETIDDTIDGGIGNIVYATFYHKDQAFAAYSFLTPEGWTEFYSEEGRSLRKSFLMAPLKTYRISSKYTRRRFHPVQKRWKAHKGTDFAAPRGTPIMVTANGTVIKAGYTSGNGNYVKVKHNSKYTTQYLHMTKFAKGIKSGKFVKQGDVIGYVGSTGLATGPHVCYRFWVNGRQVDPYQQKLPDAEPIKEEYLPEFKLRMTELVELRDSLQLN